MASDNLKKIVFITNLDVLGGAENNLISMVVHPEFNKAFQSIIFSGTRPHKAIRARIEQSNVKIVQHNKFYGLRVPRFLRDRYFKRQVRSQHPDVVVFWNHVARSRQLDICKELGIKTVFFERGTGWRQHNSEKVKNFLFSVDKVLGLSWAGKRMLEERWGYNGQCAVVLNALRPEIGKTQAEPKKLPKDRPLRVGVAARLVAYKGVASVVLAMNEIKKRGLDAELHIAGNGVESETLKALARDLDVRAVFHGILEDMIGFYQYIDILVMPSIREPLGTVPIEAQSQGCPVLYSGVDGLVEVVQDGKTGFMLTPSWDVEEYLQYTCQREGMPELVYSPVLDRLDVPKALKPSDIASQVIELARSEDLFSWMSKEARQFVRDNFPFEDHVLKIKEALKDL